MWIIIQEVLPALLVIFFLTQYIVPTILGKETWSLFRKEKKKEISTTNPSSLLDEIKETESIAKEAKEKVEIVKEKAEGNLKTAEDLKKAADKLL